MGDEAMPSPSEEKTWRALAHKAYDDSLFKPIRAIGDASERLIKAVALLVPPTELGFAIVGQRLVSYLEKVAARVPDCRRISPADTILYPVLEKLRFQEDGVLSELYVNLLARAMDRDRVGEAHPAFLTVIDQLSPDEGRILHIQQELDQDPEPVRERFLIHETGSEGNGYLDHTNDEYFRRKRVVGVNEHDRYADWSLIEVRITGKRAPLKSVLFPLHRLAIPGFVNVYMEHLKALGLVNTYSRIVPST